MDGDKTSFADDIEDEEIVDFNLGEEDIQVEENVDSSEINKNIFTIDSLFIVVYEENDTIIDKLLIVQKEVEESNTVLLKDENENDEILSFDINDNLIFKNNLYSILDIEKVDEFLDDIDDVELIHTDDIYPEIDILVDEIKDKVYSLQEKKENILNELISLFKAHDDEILIFQISDMVDQIMKMYVFYEDFIYDDSDTLIFLKKMLQGKPFEIPKWLIPIISNQKRLYVNEEEDIQENKDVFIRSFKDELVEKYNLLNTLEDNSYKKVMEIIYSYSPFRNNKTVLLPHHGTYIRDCSDGSPCTGLEGPLSFDMNRTRDSLIMPVLKDLNTSFETIVSREKLSLSGFYALSHMYLDITLSPKDLTMHELYFLSDYKYSYMLLKNRLNTVQHIIDKESDNEGDNLKTNTHAYILKDKNCTFEELGNILRNNLPGYTELLNSIPKRIQSQIYNYSDFKKAYLCYNLNYAELDLENREKVNILIKTNIKNYIKNYNQSVKRRVIRKVKKKKNILSIKDRISLSRSYIMNIPIIPLRNNYLQKFIKTFSREPKATENPNFFYEKNSNDKLLCKHHLYSINIHKDASAFHTLKSVYGGEVQDGFICCKICKEYICPEDFSVLEGFSDGAPTSSKEVLDTTTDELKILTEKQTRIKKRIQKISSLFGIELNLYDKQQIIDFYELFNNQEFINERYNVKKAFELHPRVKEIKGNYKFIKPAKTQKDKMNNKKNKELMNSELSSIKEYFLDCNEIFIDVFFILFLIQTSVPSYPINSKISINLWEFDPDDNWEDIQQNVLSKISMDTIELITVLLRKIISFNQKDKFWQNIKELLLESSKYDDLPSFNQQFLTVSSYILQNQNIRGKLKEYVLYKFKDQSAIYVKDYWPTYKPFYDNKIVAMINEKTNQELKDIQSYLLKMGGEYVFSNISSIRSFKEAYYVPRFQQLKIPFSEIMKNESYERLFKYSLQLHGSTKSISIINLLIQRFIQTVNDEKVPGLLAKIGWSQSFKKLDKINYSELRNLFALELIRHFQNKNPEDSNTIKIFFHFHVNNWNGYLLNGHAKRNYSYVPPTIYPDDSFETLISTEDDKNFADELFIRYCTDDDGNIIERYSIDSFITNILADPSIEREASCENNLPKTKENFYRILDHKRNSTKLPIFTPVVIDSSIESRIKYFIRNNNYLLREADELFPSFRQLAYNKRCCSDTELRKIFNEISKHNSYLINKIQDFFVNTNELEKNQYDGFKSSFGRSIESLSVLLNKLLEKTEKLPQMITNILQTISRLSTGHELNSYLPKQWKLSETNQNNLEEFLNYNEFLLHYNIYTPIKEKLIEGYYVYLKEKKYSLCFQGFFNYIRKYFQKDLNTVLGNNNSKIPKEYSDIFNRYIFLFLFNLMIEYILNLQDDESPVSNNANILFSSLEEQDRLERKDSIQLCTRLSFDLLFDALQEFTDTNWIHQTEQLTDKLSRQKEREKQEIIDTLESKTTDARLVMVQQQNCGLSNYFHEATKNHLSHIKTDEYKKTLNDERSEFAKEFFSQNESELEIMEGQGIDTSNLQPGNSIVEEEEEVDEGYMQDDMDRESEGDDDGDESGDYREN
tara:strand:- start:976 stop:5742 length:4767 start_codon:yes stop_codon:yes gene_type:complete